MQRIRFVPGNLVSCLFMLATLGCMTSAATRTADQPPAVTLMVSGINRSANVARVDWKMLSDRLPGLKPGLVRALNLNTGAPLTVSMANDAQGQPAALVLDLSSAGRAGTVAVRIAPAPAGSPAIESKPDATPAAAGAQVDWLVPAPSWAIEQSAPLSWSRTIADSMMAFNPPPQRLGGWNYEHGFMANALYELGERTGERKYMDYAQAWLDDWITPEGKVDRRGYRPEEYQLDHILPGRLALVLYRKTGQQKYKLAAEDLLDQFKTQPRTAQGGFWHKQRYPQQMWLDGIYMGDVFLAQAAHVLKRPDYAKEALTQAEMVYQHTLDPKTGLLYHGWDSSITQVWANPQTGASPEFWGRAMGWYAMAIADLLDDVPQSNLDPAPLIKIMQSLSASLVPFQDPKTGLWYQIVDKGDRSDNWLESSCTAMFAYGMAKGVRQGHLDPKILETARKAWQGLLENEVFVDGQRRVWLLGTVQVGSLSGAGDYPYYVAVPRTPNDPKGVAALLYAAMEIEGLKPKTEAR